MIVLNDIIVENKLKGNYVALGNFDGIHRGHLQLIKKSVHIATLNKGNSMVFTFKNHPMTLTNPNVVPKLIMDLDTKLKILEDQKVDIVVLRNFTKQFMKMTPEEFIRLLCNYYNVKGIIVGFNFKFGYKNSGDVHLIEKFKMKYGYELHVLQPYKHKEDIISSTIIRKYISDGKIELANEMLSLPFKLKGIVKHGKKLGRTIGFPTANLKYDERMVIPKVGVYYTNIIHNMKKYKGITSVGNNPTVNGEELTIETYILDFDEEIYGQEIDVYFINRIRSERRFGSLDLLVKQLEKDKNYAVLNKIFI